MNEYVIVSEPDNQLAKDIALHLGTMHIPLEIHRFADTETTVTCHHTKKFAHATILLVYQFTSLAFAPSSYSINDEFLKFLLCAHTLKAYSVKKIIGFLPYLAYSRHDHKGTFSDLSLIGTLCKAAGIDSMITSDIHSPEAQHLFQIPLISYDMAPFWIEFLKKKFTHYDKKSLCIASPDAGGSHRAQLIANALSCDVITMKKKRTSPDHAHVLSYSGAIQNKTIILIDDILDTSNTALSACNLLHTSGATEVFGCFTHAVLSRGSLKQLDISNFRKIFISTTLDIQKSNFSKKIIALSITDFFKNKLAQNKTSP